MSIPAGRRRARHPHPLRRRKFPRQLALAGAVDLVSHKTRIDSCFLMKASAPSTAKRWTRRWTPDALNASGKIIGVISHVEAMKDRIPVQIKVKKINGTAIAGWTKRLRWSEV